MTLTARVVSGARDAAHAEWRALDGEDCQGRQRDGPGVEIAGQPGAILEPRERAGQALQ